jgi:hypothetical protein
MSHTHHKEFQRARERRQAKSTASPSVLRRIRKEFYGTLLGLDVWIVDAQHVRDVLDVDFCMGSHDAHSSFIPEREIWICNYIQPGEMFPLLVHEVLERENMVKRGWSYEKAHDRSSQIEILLRRQGLKKPVRTYPEAFNLAQAYVSDPRGQH